MQNIYGIILADVWTEGNRKKEILQEFEAGTFITDELDKLCAGAQESNKKRGLDPDSRLQEYEFKNLAYYSHNISTIPAYNLLGISWQID